jgi:hypothetical protein
MKKALISKNESPVNYISGWVEGNPRIPIYSPIENSCRVAQVVNVGQEFEVFDTLMWVDCDDDVIADQFYFNINDEIIYPIQNVE